MARKNDGASANPNTSSARVSCNGAKSLIWIVHANFPAHDLCFPSARERKTSFVGASCLRA